MGMGSGLLATGLVAGLNKQTVMALPDQDPMPNLGAALKEGACNIRTVLTSQHLARLEGATNSNANNIASLGWSIISMIEAWPWLLCRYKLN